MDELLCHIQAARRVLAGTIRLTPLTASPLLSRMVDGVVYLKQENLQHTNCCKGRSAFYMLSTLSPAQKRRGVVTVSTGNNGIGMSWAMQKLQIPGVVFLPHTVTPHKVQFIRQNNIEIIFHGRDIVEAEVVARDYAAQTGTTFLSPYNEWAAIYAQGTIASETLDQLAEMGQQLDCIVVPVGGGGLISGIAGYLKAINPAIQVIGVQPANSAVMYHSVMAGEILELDSAATLSDATAGGVEQGAITFHFCRHYVDDYILVSEEQIRHAMLLMYDEHQIVVEGAGALSVAALLQRKDNFVGKTVVLLLCGANISQEQFAALRGEPLYG